MSNRRGIKFQITKRIETNRQRAADVLAREEREAEAIRELNRKTAGQTPAKNGKSVIVI
jgi:hypothetical protein